MATNRRPANQQPGVVGSANGLATRRNSASTGSNPNLTRAWKIPDFDGATHDSRHLDDHDNPSVNWAKYAPKRKADEDIINITLQYYDHIVCYLNTSLCDPRRASCSTIVTSFVFASTKSTWR